MKIRVLVAKADGVPDSQRQAFAPCSIQPSTDVPVTQNFDQSLPPIGKADIEVEPDGDVYAIMNIPDYNDNIVGQYPALGGVAIWSTVADCSRTINVFDSREVSICYSRNADSRIPPI